MSRATPTSWPTWAGWANCTSPTSASCPAAGTTPWTWSVPPGPRGSYFQLPDRHPLPLPHLPAAGAIGRRPARGLPAGVTVIEPAGAGADPPVTGALRRQGASAGAGGEEGLQQRLRLGPADAVIDLGAWWHCGWRKHPRALRHAARFRVGRAVVQPRDAAPARSRRRTSGRAPASHKDHAPAAARTPPPHRPRGSPAFRHGRSGRASSRVRLPARATTAPSGATITAPTGTSPRAPAARASSSAMLHEGPEA